MLNTFLTNDYDDDDDDDDDDPRLWYDKKCDLWYIFFKKIHHVSRQIWLKISF